MYEKVIVALVTVLVPMLIKWIIGTFSRDRERPKKQRLDEIGAFLAWPISERNRLMVQEKFLYFFKYRYAFEEINYSLSTNNPLHALLLLKNYSTYVEYSESSMQIVFKEKFNTERKRNIFWFIMNTYYFIGAFMALVPILLFERLFLVYGLKGLPVILLFSVFVMFAAILSLAESGKPELASKLMRNVRPNNLSQQDAASGAAA